MFNSKRSKIISKLFISAIFIVLVLRIFFPSLTGSTAASLNNFIRFHGNFDEIRKNVYGYAPLLEAKKIIPPGSTVQLSSSGKIFYLTARYILYPSVLSEKGDYRLELMPRLKNGSVVNVFRLSGRMLTHGHAQEKYPLMRILGTFLLVSLLNIATGVIVIRGLLGGWQNFTASWYLATSYLLGFFILTASLWLFLLAGGRLGAGEVSLIWNLVIFFLAMIFRKEGKVSVDVHIKNSDFDIFEFMFKFLVSFIAISILLTGLLNPVTNWDAISHWLLKSKIFFYQQTLDLSYTHNTYYPVFWPLNIAAQYALAGGVYDELGQWTAGVFFVILLCQLRWALSCLRVPAKFVWPTILIYLIINNVFNSLSYKSVIQFSIFNTAIPENGLLAYFTGAVLFILLWLKNPAEKRFLILALVLASGMAMMKLEGIVTTVFLGSALLFLAQKKKWPISTVHLILGFFWILSIPLLWLIWIKAHGFYHGFFHGSSEFTLEKLMFIVQGALQNQSSMKIFYICVFVVLSFLLVKRDKAWNDSQIFLSFITVFLVIFSYAAFVGLPIQVINVDGVPALKRLFCHALPSLILLLASRMS